MLTIRLVGMGRKLAVTTLSLCPRWLRCGRWMGIVILQCRYIDIDSQEDLLEGE